MTIEEAKIKYPKIIKDGYEPVQPYKEIGEDIIRWYKNGSWYNLDEFGPEYFK